MAKVTFSRSDVMAINGRMSSKSAVLKEASDGLATTMSRSPSTPIAAKIMREVGVSGKKISEAYRLARITTVKPK